MGRQSKSSYGETPARVGPLGEAKAGDQAAIPREPLVLERPSPDKGVVQAAFLEEGFFTKRVLAESALPAEALPAGSDPAGRPREQSRERESDHRAKGVRAAAAQDAAGPDNWQGHLAAAIGALESELREAPQSVSGVDLQARLRMLCLLADRREDALRSITSAPPAVQEFWSQELYGLATWLGSRGVNDPGTLWVRRAGESKPALEAAVRRLGELGPLVVRNLAFITEVRSYGDYKPLAKTEFAPGQELLLYAEVENFKSDDTPKGFHTVLQPSYQVFDARGQRVASQELNTVEEHCRNPRRDFYLTSRLSLPKRIYAGKHTLQLTLVDQKSQRIGQASIEFGVKEGAE